MPRGGGLQVFNTNDDDDDDFQYVRNITKSSSDPVGGMNLDMRLSNIIFFLLKFNKCSDRTFGNLKT